MSVAWTRQRQRSNRFWIGVLALIARYMGRWPVRILLYPIVAYFYCTAADTRAASRDYLRRVQGQSANWRQIFHHMHSFAQVAADRLFLLAGQTDRFQVEISGEQVFDRAECSEHGCLLMVSHLGSFDVMRVRGAKQQARPLRILLDRRHNPLVGDVLDRLDPELAAGIIDAGQSPPALALTIDACLKQGELVGIMADRAAPGQRVERVDFLGGPAAFPVGPWQMAAVLGVPVILCFGLYRGGNRYDLHFELMSPGLEASRRQRPALITQCIEHYASRLQYYARLAPYNWFNFYDFWTDETPSDN